MPAKFDNAPQHVIAVQQLVLVDPLSGISRERRFLGVREALLGS